MAHSGLIAAKHQLLVQRAAGGDATAQKRLRSNELACQRRQNLRTRAANGDPEAQRQVEEGRQRIVAEWYRRKEKSKARIEAGDAVAQAQRQRNLKRKAERKRELAAEKRGQPALTEELHSRQERNNTTPAETNGLAEHNENEGVDIPRRKGHLPLRARPGTAPDGSANGASLNEAHAEWIWRPRRQAEEGEEYPANRSSIGRFATQAAAAGEDNGRPSDERTKSLTAAADPAGEAEAEAEADVEELRVKEETKFVPFVDLTDDDGSADTEAEELALQLEQAEYARKAAALKLKLLGLKKRR